MASPPRADRSALSWLARLLASTTLAIVLVQVTTATATMSARFDFSPLTDAQATQRLQRSTVEVESLGCDLALRQGSAVVIGPGEALTNEHVAGSSRSVDVSVPGMPLIPSVAVAVSPVADVAVLSAEALSTDALALAPYDPIPGERVHLAGFPHETVRSALPDGLVVDAAQVVDYVDGAPMGQPGQVMRLNVAASPGMSGGPVLDEAGRLAGLVFAVQSPTGDTLAVPVSVLRQLLNWHDPVQAGPCVG